MHHAEFFRFADTGVGIEAAIRERLFEPFFTTKEPGHGTGLGLASVYALVRQVGGLVALDSWPGQGTSVELLLPCLEDPSRNGE